MARLPGYGLAVVVILVCGGSAFAEEPRRPTSCGFLNQGDCDMQDLKNKGVQDLRWNHSCPYLYPVRREGNACVAAGVEVGASFTGGCCTKLTAEEDRSETCRTGLNKWVKDARAGAGRRSSPARDRAAIWYSLKKDDCAQELGEIAAQTGRALPVRGAAATPRASAAIAESLGRRPGSERRPDFVDSGGGGGGDETAAYVFEILDFALGAATIVAANYRPRIGGSYGTRNPGRLPPSNSYVRPAPRTIPSDITGTR